VKTETTVPTLGKDEFTGKQFGRFEVLCKLGEGGMSQVFLAWQKSVGGFRRAVVLKRILSSIRKDRSFLKMFLQEAKITSGLTHGNIATLHDLSHEGTELFMVIEFVPGATLVEVAKACTLAKEPIPIGLTVAVVRDVALALHYAHTFKDNVGRNRPVIHRDVAEKNIMVSFDGTTKLLDFGIAQQQGRQGHTQIGMVKGTAGYMSPEQVKGEPLDGRTDVFSLGVVLHECLTGQRLFRRSSQADEVDALLNDPIPAPSAKNRAVSLDLDAVVLKALSRQREHRFANAREMALAIDRCSSRQMWDAEQRSIFIQRHFVARQKQIEGLLGNPGSTDLGDLLDDETNGGRPSGIATVMLPRSQVEDAVAARPSPPTGPRLKPIKPQRGEEGTVEVDEEERAMLTAGLANTEEAETIQDKEGGRLLQWRSRRTRESALSPTMLGIAGAVAVVLAVLLMLLLSAKK
jgi:serine/threonine protein kinase